MKKVIIRRRYNIYVLSLDQIIYMEKDLRKIKVCMEERVFEFYGQFRDIMPELDDRFMFCHRSYLINMDKIVALANNRVILENCDDIVLGRDTYMRAVEIFNAYMEQNDA